MHRTGTYVWISRPTRTHAPGCCVRGRGYAGDLCYGRGSGLPPRWTSSSRKGAPRTRRRFSVLWQVTMSSRWQCMALHPSNGSVPNLPARPSLYRHAEPAPPFCLSPLQFLSDPPGFPYRLKLAARPGQPGRRHERVKWHPKASSLRQRRRRGIGESRWRWWQQWQQAGWEPAWRGGGGEASRSSASRLGCVCVLTICMRVMVDWFGKLQRA